MATFTKLLPNWEKLNDMVFVYDPATASTTTTTTATTEPTTDDTTALLNSNDAAAISNELHSTNAGDTVPPPKTVLVCSWADAPPKIVVKYLEHYRTTYPSAKILLIATGTIESFWARQSYLENKVRDLVTKHLFSKEELDYAHSHGGQLAPESDTDHADNRLLIHSFSTSGIINVYAVCSVWKSLIQSASPPLPHTAYIIDSAPGGVKFFTEWSHWIGGIGYGFFNTFPSYMRWAIWPCASFMVFFGIGLPVFIAPWRFEFAATWVWRFLNDTDYFAPSGTDKAGIANGAGGKKTTTTTTTTTTTKAAAPFAAGAGGQAVIPKERARLYIYSMKDPLIDWQHVEEHAAEARAKGFEKVELVRFEDTTHVGHMRKDPVRYWTAVEKTWREAVAGDK